MSASEWVGIAVIVGGLAITNPTVENVESDVRQMILMDITGTEISPDSGFGNVLMTGMCKIKPEECYQVIRATLNLQMRNYFVGKTVAIREANGQEIRFIGAVKHLWCPQFLNSSETPKQS